MVAVAMHTGLRQAEQFKLKWEHVDFTTGILTVPRSKHGEIRRLPMNDTVREILRMRNSCFKTQYVFPSETGETPIDACNYMRGVFVSAIEAAGIDTSTGTTSGTRSRVASSWRASTCARYRNSWGTGRSR